MTPTQALSVLTQATAQLPAARQTHLQIMEALQVLEKLAANSAAEQNVKKLAKADRPL